MVAVWGAAWGLDIHALHRYPNNISFNDVDIYLQISLLKISFEDVGIYLKNQRCRYLLTFRYNKITKIYRISEQICTFISIDMKTMKRYLLI